jgi:hypothetical protein
MNTEVPEMTQRIIDEDEYAPFPHVNDLIRVFFTDGQVIDGTVVRVWLDLDRVIIDMHVKRVLFQVIPSEGDEWKPGMMTA